MGGRREEGGRVTLNSLGSGWFRFRDWFVFALGWMDGWSAGGSRLVCLAGLIWSSWSGWMYSSCRRYLRSYYSFCFVCLVVRFVLYAVCCIQYTVLVLSCLCAFDIELDIEDIELPASCSYRQQLDDPDRATRLGTVACLVKVSWGT